MTEYPCSIQALPNLNTSDHVAVLMKPFLLIARFIIGLVHHGEDYIIIFACFCGIFQKQWMQQFLLLLMLLCQ